jgi:diguanylate cyclase (GGDEF)-like protein
MGYPDMMRDIVEQTRREETINRRKALENLPIVDRLTGLYSREYFDLRLDEEMARSRLYGNRLSLIFIDTGLSQWEDHGNENRISEETMKMISGIISNYLTDMIGLSFHYNQGRFVIIVPETGEQEANLIADNICKAIVQEQIQDVNPHAGVAQYKNHENIDELIQAADVALHENIKKVHPVHAYF